MSPGSIRGLPEPEAKHLRESSERMRPAVVSSESVSRLFFKRAGCLQRVETVKTDPRLHPQIIGSKKVACQVIFGTNLAIAHTPAIFFAQSRKNR
jgi:hypothetical protein